MLQFPVRLAECNRTFLILRIDMDDVFECGDEDIQKLFAAGGQLEFLTEEGDPRAGRGLRGARTLQDAPDAYQGSPPGCVAW